MIYDLTYPLSAATEMYPGDAPPVLTRLPGPLLATHLSLNCHTGTHVDAPAHFLTDGATLDSLPLERFFGPAVVLDSVEDDLPGNHHLMFRVEHLTPEQAERICTFEPLSVGVPSYSVDPYGSTKFTAHRVFAHAGVPVFVRLNLAAAPAGRYWFCGLPLRLVGAEASPLRAILIEQQPKAVEAMK